MKVYFNNSKLVFNSINYIVNETVAISNSNLYRPQVDGSNFVFQAGHNYKVCITWLKEGTLTEADNLNIVSVLTGIVKYFQPSVDNGIARDFSTESNLTAIFQSSSDVNENYIVQIWEVVS